MLVQILVLNILAWPSVKPLFLDTEKANGSSINSTGTNLETLILAQVIFRHGDRSPYTEYPKDPYNNESYWPNGFKALTKQGILREFRLGQYIRSRYNGFLSTKYKPSEIYVETSSSDRAIMSALANLAGIYPVFGEEHSGRWSPAIDWQPIPVHTLSSKDDNYLNFEAPCRRFSQLKRESYTTLEFAREINEANKDLYAYISEHTGLNVTDFELVSDLFDTLWIQKNNNLTLPSWTDKVYDKMAELAPLQYDSRVTLPNEEAKRVKAGPLLSKLTKNMVAAIPAEGGKAASFLRLHMFAGHDSTIATLLGTFGEFHSEIPGFASAVFVELHSRVPPEANATAPDSFANYEVMVFYKNETERPPFEVNINSCGRPCRLSTFQEIFRKIMIDETAWAKACEGSGSS